MITQSTYDVIIIGAGLSGLVSAIQCQSHGLSTLLVDAHSEPGGRIRSDRISGAICDHGFQVFLPSYPIASDLFSSLPINWCYYPRMASILTSSPSWFGMASPFYSTRLFGPKCQPSVRDYIQLAIDCCRGGWSKPQWSLPLDLDSHIDNHYSPAFAKAFLKPFFRSVFLDPSLRVSTALFSFYLYLFLRGGAAIPSGGMGQITSALANQLTDHTLQLNQPVRQLIHSQDHWSITTSSHSLTAAHVIVATDHYQASQLCDWIKPPKRSLPVSTHFFLSDTAVPTLGPLTLIPSNDTCHHIACPTLIAPEYTESNHHLYMVTTLGQSSVPQAAVIQHLRDLNCHGVDDWQWIHHIAIERSLPTIDDCDTAVSPYPNLTLAGDWTSMPSIEGACRSGLDAANAAIRAVHS